MVKLNSHQIRKIGQGSAKEISKDRTVFPIEFVLADVEDTYNIGSFFRLADGVGVKKIHICGDSVLPPNIKIHRSSIGTWKIVDWDHHLSTVDCIKKLKKQNYQIVACELANDSIDFRNFTPTYPTALVLGNERIGISQEILNLCDKKVMIPMYGINKSLNVLVSASVISYYLVSKPLIHK